MFGKVICVALLIFGCNEILASAYKAGASTAEYKAEIKFLEKEVKDLKEKLRKFESK